MRYFVYKYVYHGDIIYIGKTDNIQRRIIEHSSGQGLEEKFLPYLNESDVYYHECGNEVEMSALERLLINQYKPLLNIKDVSDGVSTVTIDIDWKYYAEVFNKRWDLISEDIAKCNKNIASNQTRIKNYEEEIWSLRQYMISLLPFYRYLDIHYKDFINNHNGFFKFHKHELHPTSQVQIGDFIVNKWYDAIEFDGDIAFVQLSGELLQRLFAIAHKSNWIDKTMDNIGKKKCKTLYKRIANLQRKIDELQTKKTALENEIHTNNAGI